jgi:hypothetical protein
MIWFSVPPDQDDEALGKSCLHFEVSRSKLLVTGSRFSQWVKAFRGGSSFIGQRYVALRAIWPKAGEWRRLATELLRS